MSDKYTSMTREMTLNLKQIKRLTDRNKALAEAINAVDRLTNSPAAVSTAKGPVKPQNKVGQEILDYMNNDGRAREVPTISLAVLGHLPDKTEAKMISNYLRRFALGGQLEKLARGKYKAVANKSEAKIGPDTKVKQVPTKAPYPMEPDKREGQNGETSAST